jgi:hypothetical protein
LNDATDRKCDDCGTFVPIAELHRCSITLSAQQAGATRSSYVGDASTYFSVRGELCPSCLKARKDTIIALDELWSA